MKGRTPTKDEREFQNQIAEIGCIVCRNQGIENDYVSLHHIEGRVKQGAHYHVIPLCERHHQIADTDKPKRWISLHGDGKAAFTKEYGSEYELHQQCVEIANVEA